MYVKVSTREMCQKRGLFCRCDIISKYLPIFDDVLFPKSDLNSMGIKPCVLFTELGGLVEESLVFYIDINTPRPTYFRGKMID